MPRPTNAELIEKSKLSEQGLKRCRKCREVLPLGTFGVYARSPDGIQSQCKGCVNARNRVYEKAEKVRDPVKYAERKRREKQEWIKNHPERYREGVRKNNLRRYGLTPESFDSLLSAQGGRCGICKERLLKGRGTHVDHCHDTGAVRGLLCGPCNAGLGQFYDSPEQLRAAAEYLEKNIIEG